MRLNIQPLELTPLFKSATLISYCFSIAACMNNTVSFKQDQVQINVAENTTGFVWQAKAQSIEEPNQNLRYSLKGEDADLFSINATSGEIAFKTPADFELPTDANKNNEYQLDIEARTTANSALQHLYIKVNDVNKPTLNLEKPRPNENVGADKLGAITTEARVRFFDAESNMPLKNSSVSLNGVELSQDVADPQVWSGPVTVPENFLDVQVDAVHSEAPALSLTTKFLNKPYVSNPSFLGLKPEKYIIFYDPQRSSLNKLDLRNNLIANYITDRTMSSFFPIHAWNPDNEDIYALKNDTQKLKALRVNSSTPGIYSAGCFPGTLSLTYDKTNKRVLALTQDTASEQRAYKALAIATSDNTHSLNRGPAFEIQEINSEAPCTITTAPSVFEIPSSKVPGKVKYFAFHEASSSFILADERVINGVKTTHVQSFNAAGDRQFTTKLSGESSNLTINQTAGYLYVVENYSSREGILKEIDIKSGNVRQLRISLDNVNLGAYSNIQFDALHNWLYIGDDVSDSIFVVDLVTQLIRDLNIRPVLVPVFGEE